LDWADDPDFAAWCEGDGILGRAEKLRQLATRYWRSAEQRTYYSTLRPDSELRAQPRLDLAATTAGLIIQAVGRLVRGGVPFHAYFVDAAWAPNNAKPSGNAAQDAPAHELGSDTPRTSLLAAVIELLGEYATDPIGKELYLPLADALACLREEGFRWEAHPGDKPWPVSPQHIPLSCLPG
jgi:hypothetical protein